MTTNQKTTTVKIEHARYGQVNIAGLLSKLEHVTEDVQAMMDALKPYEFEGGLDVQIMEPGYVFVENLCVDYPLEIVKALEEATGQAIQLKLSEGTYFFTEWQKRDGQSWQESGYILASSYEEAKQKFAQEIWDAIAKSVFSDDYVLFNDTLIEEMKNNGEDTSFYEGEGYYDGSVEPFEPLLLLKEVKGEGIENFQHDVFTFTIDLDRVA